MGKLAETLIEKMKAWAMYHVINLKIMDKTELKNKLLKSYESLNGVELLQLFAWAFFALEKLTSIMNA